MRLCYLPLLWLLPWLLTAETRGQLLISEVLFNPPGTDSPNEYIELRGTPNSGIPAGTYFVAVEGRGASNPGTILNVVDLSGRKLGGNGFLVLLQKGTPYTANPGATTLVNTGDGAGWGSGSSSSIGHRGQNGLTELANVSVTFLLIQTTGPPVPGEDIDSNNDGIRDAAYGDWQVLDSVGVLSATGTGDIAYGQINFRRDSAPGDGALAFGTIVPIPFTPQYVARFGNSGGWTTNEWAAGDTLAGAALDWELSSTGNTYPVVLAGASLNHLGSPNFGGRDNVFVVLNEVCVNPPGTNDGPWEFIELRGTPGLRLDGVRLLALAGDSARDPGTITLSTDLSGTALGTNGLLLVVGTTYSRLTTAETTLVRDAALDQPGGALDNGSCSILLVAAGSPIAPGTDLDAGDNGVLEELPPDTLILDCVSWSDGDNGDVIYGGVNLKGTAGPPDAATRLPSFDQPRSAAAWAYGDLEGENGNALLYDTGKASASLPPGLRLSPGNENRLPPMFSRFAAFAGVIGDPTNPVMRFSVSDPLIDSSTIQVACRSDNPLVAPDANLRVVSEPGGDRSLNVDPVGVGYATFTLVASNSYGVAEVAVPYAASAPGRTNTAWHYNAGDGSTALAIDADYMYVGDDENQTLRLYERHRSGTPVREFDMTPFLALPDAASGKPREVDVEASTRVGNRLFWMGSLGHAAFGESRTNRTRVFATDHSGTGPDSTLTYAGRYDFLKVDLIQWDAENRHGKGTNYYGLEASDAEGVPPKAPDGSGFAVEGLSMAPGNTNVAYVAFRAPIVPATNRTYALIVPVLNFAEVAASGGPPGSCVFGEPIELDLYGRGIRSLECGPEGCILVAGPAGGLVGAYPRDFRLYTWTGNPADKPEQRVADLAGLNPEGIVELPPAPWTPDTEVELLSDNGTALFYGDGLETKQLSEPRFKKCRSDRVVLGPITKPAPFFTRLSRSGETVTLQWRSLAGETYHLETATLLDAAAWTALPGAVIADGPYATIEIILPSAPAYFRLAVSAK